MSQIKVKCPLCNHIRIIPDIYAHKAIKCSKCHKTIEAKPCDEPQTNKPESASESVLNVEKSKQAREKPLYAVDIAGVWNIVGFLYGVTALLLVMGYAGIATRRDDLSTEHVIWMLIAAPGLFILGGLVPFTIGVTLKSVNAIRLELRELRNEIKKSNTERGKAGHL